MMALSLLGSGFVTGSGLYFLPTDRELGRFFLASGILTAARTAWLMFMRGAA